MDKNNAVFGIYPSTIAAENAVETLRQEKFRNTDVSVLLPASEIGKILGHQRNSDAPTGAALGWLAGMGALAIPGLGPFVGAGPMLGVLASAGAGGIMGSLVGMGIPEYEAKRYDGRIRDGGVLLSVQCANNDWKERAEKVLDRTGAQDISAADAAPDLTPKRKSSRSRK